MVSTGGALAELVAPGSQHVASVEDGGLLSEAMGPEERLDPTPAALTLPIGAASATWSACSRTAGS